MTQTYQVEFELSYEAKAAATLALRLMAARMHLEALTEAAIVLEQAQPRVKRPFLAWLAKVDERVWEIAGCGVLDLPDCPLRDWYDERLTPTEAVRLAIMKPEYRGG